MRETLRDLASRHAAARLTKKQRNAELRDRGFDPDGDDGRRYRRFFDAARYGEKAAEFVEDVSSERGQAPAEIVLWDLPRSEHEAWIAAGCGEEDWQNYQRRLHATIDALDCHGHKVRTVRPTVEEVLAKLDELGLENTPEGRAVAIATLAENEKRGGDQ